MLPVSELSDLARPWPKAIPRNDFESCRLRGGCCDQEARLFSVLGSSELPPPRLILENPVAKNENRLDDRLLSILSLREKPKELRLESVDLRGPALIFVAPSAVCGRVSPEGRLFAKLTGGNMRFLRSGLTAVPSCGCCD